MMDRDDQMILTLLKAIDDSPDTTQKDLATQLGVAVGLVNSYLKRVIYKGYVKTKQLDRRRLKYLITPTGIKEKSRLTFEFLQYSYQYVMLVRRKVKHQLLSLQKEGCKSVILIGSGEMAELSYIAIRELDMDLHGIVDAENAGERCVDHDILDLDWLQSQGSADVLIVLNSSAKGNLKTTDLKIMAVEKGMKFFSIE
ncbi:MAG: MarR family winged helix-turn-helix transcriptional regulator [Candidatus Hinthialibacter antarcticus]|nr:MarR family winged helix-turn-helix transcriptional regulator [Candidatus Hinthialibacter antarcticus]